MINSKSERQGFLVLLVILLVLAFYVLSPFLKTIVLSIILAIFFFPAHKKILRFTHQRKKLSASLSLLAVIFLILAPLAVLLVLVTTQIKDMSFGASDQMISSWYVTLQVWVTKFEDLFGIQIHLLDTLQQGLQRLGEVLAQYSPAVVLGTANFILHFFIMMIVLFYLFIDGERFFEIMIRITPVKDQYERKLASEIKNTLSGVFYSSFFTGLLQAAVATLGYYIAGVSGYLVWGCVTFFVSFIPMLGTSVVVIPLVLLLISQGRVGHAVFLGIYAAVFVGLIDNILKPLLIKSNMHPLVLFLGFFGGLAVFGPAGILIGPILMSLLTATLKMYSRDFTGEKL